ncbi:MULTISPECIES: LysR family transcriptional regulator [Variovorax]|uniref:DNA-binding transcriptional LysR family regulator n=2 Tax=Comamonadaceae TaxID=80864 RepID=A0AAW8DSH4_9BURK|nr:LysR family transcriptional regulator [Variovorax boronicumulans]MDP9876610.1 DNA-binding transcriptional LysR family regulator [Variovorax boronicumulans]MDP9922513.1 DNA-binding transcriptional LysR family regulator [Variovorax boronicumulans]TSD54152.1 LysR family transcriptional regulator [Variovorax sp. KBS0712]
MAIHKKPLSMRGVPSVRQLRAFAAVYHSGQLSSAAAALSLTQPAVSVLLRELEARLGVRLFDRTTRSLQRTEAANEAIAYAERVLAELDALGTGMAELAAGRRGRVRIAATSTIAQTLMPKALRRYLDLHPDVKVAIEDCAPGQFVEKVLGEQVDFGVGTLQARTPGLDQRVFVHDHLAVIADRDLRLPGTDRITWRQLAGHPLITVKPGYGVRSSIDIAAATAGVRLDIAYEVTLLTTALAMAASGLGPALLPASILAHADHTRLVARRLMRPTVARNIAVVTRQGRSLSPAAAAFADLLVREFAIA